jgi:hypothetical protein
VSIYWAFCGCREDDADDDAAPFPKNQQHQPIIRKKRHRKKQAPNTHYI